MTTLTTVDEVVAARSTYGGYATMEHLVAGT